MTDRISIIEARHVKKHFVQGTSRLEVLRDVSVMFIQGQSYAVTGISGSGKSTFMHLMTALEQPDAGQVLYNGMNVYEFSPKERERFLLSTVGLVFQAPHLMPECSVLENVAMKGVIGGMSFQERCEWARELLSYVGLIDKADEFPKNLSGGQQQRVAVARSLFYRPAFLFADEPTGHLDQETGFQLIELLLSLQKKWSMGLVVSSHDPQVVRAMEQVWRLRDGHMISDNNGDLK